MIFKNVIFKPVSHETGVIGYWLDGDGKLYKDNIETVPCISIAHTDGLVNSLFSKGEKAVFMLGTEKAYIFNSDDSFKVLKNNIVKYYRKERLQDESFIKVLCKKYGGLTIYFNIKDESGCPTVDIWN